MRCLLIVMVIKTQPNQLKLSITIIGVSIVFWEQSRVLRPFFQSAIDADPKFALAHVGHAREMQLRGRSDAVKKSLHAAFEVGQNLSQREQSHLNVSRLLLQGKSAEARSAVYEHVKEWPRDVLIAQMCTSVFGLIGFSGLPGREAEQLAFMQKLA